MKEYVRSAGIAGHEGPMTTIPQSALSDVHETFGQASGLAGRIMDLADRLCGPYPHKDEARVGEPPSGDLGRLRLVARDTREALSDANEALARIERELIG